MAILLGLVACSALVFGVSTYADEGDKKESKIDWKEEVPDESDKPMVLYFTADWCGPCQAMQRTTWIDDDVVKASRNFTMVKIDFDNNREIAQKHRITGIPAVVVIGTDGQEKDRFSGFRNAEQAKEFFEKNKPAEDERAE